MTPKPASPHNGKLAVPKHEIEPIERAMEICGGKRTDLARELDVSWQIVSLWLSGKGGIPGERAVQIELATGGLVRREEIRPDLYIKFTDAEYDMAARQC